MAGYPTRSTQQSAETFACDVLEARGGVARGAARGQAAAQGPWGGTRRC